MTPTARRSPFFLHSLSRNANPPLRLQECYTWAADGQCQLNPGHMLTSCKYSCWEWYNFRSKSPKYADAAIDRSMDCYQWANQGECGANAVGASPATHADFRAALPPARAIRYLFLSLAHARTSHATASAPRSGVHEEELPAVLQGQKLRPAAAAAEREEEEEEEEEEEGFGRQR